MQDWHHFLWEEKVLFTRELSCETKEVTLMNLYILAFKGQVLLTILVHFLELKNILNNICKFYKKKGSC